MNKIPEIICRYIKEDNRLTLNDNEVKSPIGGVSVMHTHNTFPSVAQALKCPMWEVPDTYTQLTKNNPEYLEEIELTVNNGSFGRYRQTQNQYISFSSSLLERVNEL